MLRFPPGIKNIGKIYFATSILQVVLNQAIFKKAFACLISLAIIVNIVEQVKIYSQVEIA